MFTANKKIPLSTIILTYNEEQNIEECLKSVHEWVDEIFIVDSFSTDKTLEIASKYTDNIYKHPFENYSVQRNWSQDNLPIRNEWVFHLDADERATPELVDELNTVLATNLQGVSGFLISRKTVFLGRWIKYGGHYPAYHLRIFKKDCGRCEDRLYDQHFYADGQLLTLKSDIIDIIAPDVKTWLHRHHKWDSQEAFEAVNNSDNPLNKTYTIKGNISGNPIEKRRWLREKYYKMPILLRPFFYFFYRYIIRRGFMDGKEGLIFHFLLGFWYRFQVDLRICKMWLK